MRSHVVAVLRHVRLPALSLPIACLATSVCAGATAATSTHGAPLKPPVIHEAFTLLPCPRSQPQAGTTIGVEGSEEHTILQSDAKIDALAGLIFARLPDAPSRRRFVAAEAAWLAYRGAFCTSESDIYQGGTAAPLLYGSCAIAADAQHIDSLTAFHKDFPR